MFTLKCLIVAGLTFVAQIDRIGQQHGVAIESLFSLKRLVYLKFGRHKKKLQFQY